MYKFSLPQFGHADPNCVVAESDWLILRSRLRSGTKIEGVDFSVPHRGEDYVSGRYGPHSHMANRDAGESNHVCSSCSTPGWDFANAEALSAAHW